ncbi:MAG TPA: cupin domain-containing protein, partial [Candidatus Dormibacteraeota bacterium]|nr:cupin domain-containing protein [Candidatus Dormibacteraeota bacterium]
MTVGRKGDVLENPRRRERVTLLETADETAGKRLTMAVHQEPSAVRMPEHFHPYQRETFTINSGGLTYVLGRAIPRVARAGDVVVVEPGVPHQWWNEGPEPVEMVGVMEPAGRFVELMETIYGLTNDGKVSSNGMP